MYGTMKSGEQSSSDVSWSSLKPRSSPWAALRADELLFVVVAAVPELLPRRLAVAATLTSGALTRVRWQLAPSYLAAALFLLLLVFPGRPAAPALLTASLALCTVLLSVLVPMLMPVETRGRYAVAQVVRHFGSPDNHDKELCNWDEKLLGEPARPLELMAAIYYPVNKETAAANAHLHWRSAPYEKTLGVVQRFRRSWNFPQRHALYALAAAVFLELVMCYGPGSAGASREDVAFDIAALFLAFPVGRFLQGAGAAVLAVIFAAQPYLRSPSLFKDQGIDWTVFSSEANLRVLFLALLGWTSGRVQRSEARGSRRARIPYMSKPATDAVAEFAKVPRFMFSHLQEMRMCALDGDSVVRGQELFPPACAPGDKLPIIVLFGGLGSNIYMYSVLAQELASHGYVVICPEHNAGASARTILVPLPADDNNFSEAAQNGNGGRSVKPKRRSTTSGVRVYEYIKPPKELEQGRRFRQAQLSRRMAELLLVVDNLRGQLEPLSLGKLVDTENVMLLGHSFGGATALEAAYRAEESKLPLKFKAAVLLDAWTWPLTDEGLEHAFTTPLVFLTTKPFQNDANRKREVQLADAAAREVQAKRNRLCLRAELLDGNHQSFADVALLAPFVGKRIGSIGSADPIDFLDRTADVALAAAEVFLRPQQLASQQQHPQRVKDLLTGNALTAAIVHTAEAALHSLE